MILKQTNARQARRLMVITLVMAGCVSFIAVMPLRAETEGMADANSTVAPDQEAHLREAERLNAQGVAAYRSGHYSEAIAAIERALELRREFAPEDHLSIATNLNNLAELLRTTGRYAEAEPLYREALAMRRAALPESHPDIATSLSYLALLLSTTGRYGEAEPLNRAALAIYREALPEGHPYIATSLNNLAILLSTTGRYGEAEPLLRDALARRRAALPEGHPDIAQGLNNLADLFRATGRYAEAEPLLREALAINRAARPEGHPDIALSINNLAFLLYTTGRYGEAEPLLREALAMRRAALPAGHPDIAQSLNNLADLLRATGRYAEAEPLLREALAMLRTAYPEDHPDIAASLNNLAELLRTIGRYGEIEALYREALEILRQAYPGGHIHTAKSLNNLAVWFIIAGRTAEAEPLLREALAIQRENLPEGHPDIAGSLHNLALLRHTTGRSAEAEPLYQEALRIAQASGAPEALWSVQGELANFYTNQAQRPLGIFFGKQAVNTLQAIRQELTQTEQATQQAFLQSKEHYYKNLANWLIAEGRLPEAQQVLAMLKEQEYHDFIRRDAAAEARQTQADYNPFEAEQLAAYETHSRTLAALGAEYRALTDIDPFALSPEQEARLRELQAALQVAYQDFQQALDGIKTAFAALSDARRQELAARQVVQGKDDRGLVRDLGSGVALLQTLVMPERLHLLLTLPEVSLAREVGITEERLNAQVQTLRATLQDPQRDPRPAAQALYASLIAPIAPELKAAGIDTLMVGLDGALRYIPLAALHDGERYLIERLALTVFTEVARDNLKQPPAADWSGIGLGVSLPHEAVGPTRSRFSALPMVPQELKRIIRSDPEERGVLPGRAFLDAAFTAPVLRKALHYPVLHVASHFSLQPGNETQSFLLLGDGDTLNLGQIRQDNYDFGRVELLTLSACDTAVGGTNAHGREVEGLGALAQKQGAKAVIATLWPVADASTGLFMQQLYQRRQEQQLTKAEALRRTQIAFLRGATATAMDDTATARQPVALTAAADDPVPEFTPDPERPYAHPYYWAPFILMGNWL